MTATHARNRSAAPLVRRLVLSAVGLLLVPLALYPRRLGFPPFDLNPVVGLFEWAFYVGVLSIATTRLPFSTRIVAAGFTVVFRLIVGAASGTFVALIHSAPVARTVVELMWSYPLSLIPQVLASPVILSPLWEQMMSSGPVRRPVARTAKGRAGRISVPSTERVAPTASASRATTAMNAHSSDPSLDAAVSYLGDYGGVRLCWIVDRDGLPLAVWQRQRYTGDADFWAPISIEMIDFQRRRLSNGGAPCEPDRFELRTNQGKLVLESVHDFWLGVLTDPEADELINVRITRAREMVARHLQSSGGHVAAFGEAHYV